MMPPQILSTWAKYLTALTLVCSLLGLGWYFKYGKKSPVVANALSAHEDQKETLNLLKEAAKKRFSLTGVNVANGLPPNDQAEITDTLTQETMLARLISEVMDNRPDLVERAESLVLARHPMIMKISQSSSGDSYEQTFVVANTTNCAALYEDKGPRTLNLEQLFSSYCVDKIFDYPGGFDANTTLSVSVYPIEQRDKIEGADNVYEKLVQVALRGVVIDDFAPLYKTTGKLSYAQ